MCNMYHTNVPYIIGNMLVLSNSLIFENTNLINLMDEDIVYLLVQLLYIKITHTFLQ